MALNCKLTVWVSLGNEEYEPLEWITDEDTAIAAVSYFSNHRVPCEASRETVEVLSGDYNGLPGNKRPGR